MVSGPGARRAREYARRLALQIGAHVPREAVICDALWESVAEADAQLLRALADWEERGDGAAGVTAAANALLAAWAEAVRRWERSARRAPGGSHEDDMRREGASAGGERADKGREAADAEAADVEECYEKSAPKPEPKPALEPWRA